MNEQLQGKLVEILSAIQSAAGQAGDFAMEQLPDIAAQYVAYGRVVHVVGIVLALGGLFGCFKLFKWLIATDQGEFAPMVLFIATPVAIVLVGNIGPALMVWFAPKVWLLKELAALVK